MTSRVLPDINPREDPDGVKALETTRELWACMLCGRLTNGRALFYLPRHGGNGFPPSSGNGRLVACVAVCNHHRLTKKNQRLLERRLAHELAAQSN
jgi:hypothetical protein